MTGRRSVFVFSPLESTADATPVWRADARRRRGECQRVLDPLPNFVWSVFWRAFCWTLLPGVILLAAASWVR